MIKQFTFFKCTNTHINIFIKFFEFQENLDAKIKEGEGREG